MNPAAPLDGSALPTNDVQPHPAAAVQAPSAPVAADKAEAVPKESRKYQIDLSQDDDDIDDVIGRKGSQQ